MPTRNPLLDIAKGLGILLVVLGHSLIALRDKGALYRVIFSFHMPLFLVLSGVFVRGTAPIGSFLAGRAKGLLVPYLLVPSLWAVLGLVPAGPAFLQGLLYGTASTLGPWVPLWFLPHLLLASLALWGLLRTGLPARVLALGVPLLLLGGSLLMPLAARPLPFRLPGEVVGLPWSLDLLPVSLACLLAGHLLARPIQAFRFRGWAALGSAGIFVLLHLLFPQTLDLSARLVGHPLVSILKAVAGVHLVLSLAALLGRAGWLGRALATLGRSSLAILVLHGYCQGMAVYLAGRAFGSPRLADLLGLVSGVLVPLGIWALLRWVRQGLTGRRPGAAG